MGIFSKSDAASDEIERGLQYAKDMMTQTRADFDPYMQSGTRALSQYEAQLGLGGEPAFDVSQIPGYQQQLQAGLDAVNQAGAGSGMLMSGSRLQGLQDVGQQTYGQFYDNYMNRLMGLQGQGAQMTSQLGSLGQQSAGTVLGGYTTLGEAKAAEEAAYKKQMGDLVGAVGFGLGGSMGMIPGMGRMGGGGGIGDPNAMAESGGSGGGGGFFGTLMKAAPLAMMAACDSRLKENIKHVGEKEGVDWYTWDWNEKAYDVFGLEGSSEGVIAQDVMGYAPHALGEHSGYLTVDYAALGVSHG